MGFEQGSLRLLGNINRLTVQEHTWRKMRDYMNQGFGGTVWHDVCHGLKSNLNK